MQLSESFFRERRLEKMVENQTSYALSHAELHVFETHQKAEQVFLRFNQPVLASMLEGKKIMHLNGQDSFDFLPGESLIMPSDELMCIDFPEAKKNTPTRCLAMAIDDQKILKTLELMNDKMQKSDDREWNMMDYNFHFTNDKGIYQILSRLLYLFTEDHPSKDLFVDNMLQELIVRIIQADQRKVNESAQIHERTNQRIHHVISFIKENFSKKLNSQELSDKACMSESHFFRIFRNEMGMSPIEYVNKIRLEKAASLLSSPSASITEVYLECGFESRSYFNRMFKKYKGLSPSRFQKRFK